MHIAIDAHSVGAQHRGNETYAVNLIEALAEIDPIQSIHALRNEQSAADRFTNRGLTSKVNARCRTRTRADPLILSAEPAPEIAWRFFHVHTTAPPLAHAHGRDDHDLSSSTCRRLSIAAVALNFA